MINRSSRLEYVFNIKAIAILMVVFLHSASPLFYQLGQIDIKRWVITALYVSSVRCAVPLFLMVSGAIILNKDYKIKEWIIHKIIKRLTFPFIFYYLVTVLINNKPLLSFFVLLDIGYWFPFFGIILTLYLLYPLIRTWLKHTDSSWIAYFLIIWFFSIIVGFSFPSFTLYSLNFIYLYIGYPILGYALSNCDTRKYKLFALAEYVFSILLVFLFTMLISGKTNRPDEKYFSYLSPYVVLMSASVFIFIKNIDIRIKNKILISTRNFLSNHSYGIFFLHPLIISHFYFLHSIINPIFSDWIIFIAGIFVTSSIIFILSKVPIIKKFVG